MTLYGDWYGCNDAEFEEDDTVLEDDIAFLGYCFGVSESDIEILLDYGYTLDEIEDLLIDGDTFEEAVQAIRLET